MNQIKPKEGGPMLRIAVCDDMPDELQSLVSLINQHISERIALTDNENGTFAFTMPDSNVTVSAA